MRKAPVIPGPFVLGNLPGAGVLIESLEDFHKLALQNAQDAL